MWETLSADAVATACGEHGRPEPGEADVFVHLTRRVNKERRRGRDKGRTVPVTETTIYRRLGPDKLPDGSDHPAPWARLERQFVIKLQGEERPARAACNGKLKDGSRGGPDELRLAADLARALGLVHDQTDCKFSRGIDEVMRRALRIVTVGLKRHGRRAKIAYAFMPDCPGIPEVGGKLKPFTRGDDEHLRFLTKALMEWHALGADSDWDGSAERVLWNTHIKSLPDGFEIGEPPPPDPNTEPATRAERKDKDEELRRRIEPIARHLAADSQAVARIINEELNKLWKGADGHERTKDDFEHTPIRDAGGKIVGSRTAPKQGNETGGGWYARLRLLTDWIMGWNLPGARSAHWNRKVGGLSLTRIATMKSLYQLHKAFAMRPRPWDLRGAPEKGESNAGVAQSILDAMERMREQRVKQIASRIVEAALGVGSENPVHWKNGRKRPQGSAGASPQGRRPVQRLPRRRYREPPQLPPRRTANEA